VTLLVAVALAGAALLGGCGDDSGSDESSDDSTVEGRDSAAACPFEAASLSDAMGIPVEEAQAPADSPAQLECVFIAEGANIEDLETFTVASVRQDPAVALGELNTNAAEQQGYQPLPELGPEAFVVTSTTPVGDGTNLNEAIVTYEVDGQVFTAVLVGATPPPQLAGAVAGVVSLLSG
jgi:hypothetical protein